MPVVSDVKAVRAEWNRQVAPKLAARLGARAPVGSEGWWMTRSSAACSRPPAPVCHSMGTDDMEVMRSAWEMATC